MPEYSTCNTSKSTRLHRKATLHDEQVLIQQSLYIPTYHTVRIDHKMLYGFPIEPGKKAAVAFGKEKIRYRNGNHGLFCFAEYSTTLNVRAIVAASSNVIQPQHSTPHAPSVTVITRVSIVIVIHSDNSNKNNKKRGREDSADAGGMISPHRFVYFRPPTQNMY